MSGSAYIDQATVTELTGIMGAGQFMVLVDLFEANAAERREAIASAADKGDMELVKTTAHALKGAAASLGAMRVAELARAIEIGEAGADETLPLIRGALGLTIGELRQACPGQAVA